MTSTVIRIENGRAVVQNWQGVEISRPMSPTFNPQVGDTVRTGGGNWSTH